MYCYNCGKQIEDDSAFCPFCGTALKTETKKTSEPKKEEIKETISETPKEEKKLPLIPIICGAVGVVVAVIIIACATLTGGKSINILDNVDLVFEGYNGFGKPSFVLEDEDLTLSFFEDTLEDLQEEYHNVCELENPEGENCKKFEDKVYAFGTALESIEYSYATTNDKPIDELSNGDTVTIKIDYDKEAFKKAGYKLKNTTKKYKVEGLPNPEEIDVLSYAKPEWKSDGGDFYLSVEKEEGCPIDEIPCTISEPDDNGDVTITIDNKTLSSNYGYYVKDENMTKTVHVGHAPARIDYLSDDNREQITKLALKTLADVYVSKCGYVLYGEKEELMYGIDESCITNLSVSNGKVKATFNIKTYEGGEYRKSISFEAYIDSEGEYVNATEYDKESLSCSIEHGTWPEH